ncbi:hypothetical protein GJ744_009249 [Endocarpon pusillum]|uniref:Uncharacterized protein n=1 Tax=Endocarpon pusillum TaxID=364733 RepID=A0A8H7AJS3_9EURO|nr:hypothetical protein GJ744_009249 [Endocarpon pusillum]
MPGGAQGEINTLNSMLSIPRGKSTILCSLTFGLSLIWCLIPSWASSISRDVE